MKIDELLYEIEKYGGNWGGISSVDAKTILRNLILAALPEEKTEGIKGILGTDHREGIVNEGWNAYKREAEIRIAELFK